MRASLAVWFFSGLLSHAAFADESSPPAPLTDEAFAPDDIAPADTPPVDAKPVENAPEAPVAPAAETNPDPVSDAAPVVDEGSGVPTWLYTIPLGCVTFTAVWWIASAVLAPLNAVAGLGGIVALALAAVTSSYAQVAVGDYFGDTRGSVLPGAIASACGTIGCMVPGLVGVMGVFMVGFFGTFAALVGSLQGGNVDPRVVGASLGAAGFVGVVFLVVGIFAAILTSIPVGQIASAIATSFFREPLLPGEEASFEVPGFLSPVHTGGPSEERGEEGDVDEEPRRDAPTAMVF